MTSKRGYVGHPAGPTPNRQERQQQRQQRSSRDSGGGGRQHAGRQQPRGGGQQQQPRRQPQQQAPRGGGGGGRPAVERFADALMQHESGGKNIPNRGGHSTASGYWQYTDGTWNNYKGYSRAMHAPYEVQRERVLQDLGRAYDQYGDWERVAMSHFYPAWASKPKSAWNRTPAPGNPTAAQFVSSVMSNFGQGGGASVAAPDVRQQAGGQQVQGRDYPTTPPPLGRGDIAELSSRRRAATRRLQEAEARRRAEQQRIGSAFERFKESLEREAQQREDDQRAELAGQGMALQPRGMGNALRTIRDWHAEQLAEERSSTTERLAALEEMVRQQRANRDRQHAQVDADTARRRTKINDLITSVGG